MANVDEMINKIRQLLDEIDECLPKSVRKGMRYQVFVERRLELSLRNLSAIYDLCCYKPKNPPELPGKRKSAREACSEVSRLHPREKNQKPQKGKGLSSGGNQ